MWENCRKIYSNLSDFFLRKFLNFAIKSQSKVKIKSFRKKSEGHEILVFPWNIPCVGFYVFPQGKFIPSHSKTSLMSSSYCFHSQKFSSDEFLMFSQKLMMMNTEKREFSSLDHQYEWKIYSAQNLFVGLFMRRLGRIIQKLYLYDNFIVFLVRREVGVEPVLDHFRRFTFKFRLIFFRVFDKSIFLKFPHSAKIWKRNIRKCPSFRPSIWSWNVQTSNRQIKFGLILSFNKKRRRRFSFQLRIHSINGIIIFG